jgi:GNAT superfamily N-acetyltransferase
VHRWLSTDAYWALGRSRDTVERSVAGSIVFGAYEVAGAHEQGRQVAVARAVTDGATFAWICDVYVDPAARGRGLGKRLVGALRDHLNRLGVRRMILATHDAHGVYAALGFTPLAKPEQWMELDRR